MNESNVTKVLKELERLRQEDCHKFEVSICYPSNRQYQTPKSESYITERERDREGQEICQKFKNSLGYILWFQGSLGYRMRLSKRKKEV